MRQNIGDKPIINQYKLDKNDKSSIDERFDATVIKKKKKKKKLLAKSKGDASIKSAKKEIVRRKRRMNESHLVLKMTLEINFVRSEDD